MFFPRHVVLAVRIVVVLFLAGSSAVAQTAPSIENDPNYKHFKGSDGSRLRGADPAFAKEVVDVVMSYPGIDFELPKKDGKLRCFVETNKTSLIDGNPFEQLMIHAVDPDSQFNNEYVKLVAGLLPALNARVMASSKEITPAELIRYCLDVCQGNYPKATLLAHNYAKNITYKGRNEYRKLAGLIKLGKPYKFSPLIGAQASKLVTMRSTPDEKMGIYYHSFVPLVIAAWTGYPGAADTAIIEEYRVRTAAWLKQKIPSSIAKYLPDMGSPPDGEKKQSDLQFAEAAHEIHRKVAARPRIVVCNCSVTPASGPLGTKFKVKLNYQIQGITPGAEPVIEENMKITAHEFSRELVNENKQIMVMDSFNVEREFDFDPEVEGSHLVEFSFKGGKGGIDAEGNKPFQVTPVTGWSASRVPEVEWHPCYENASYKLDTKTNTCTITSDTSVDGTKSRGTMVLKYVPPPTSLKVGQIFEIGGTVSGVDDKGTYGGFGFSWSEPMGCFAPPTISEYALPQSIGTRNGARELSRKLRFGYQPIPGKPVQPPQASDPMILMQMNNQNTDNIKLKWKYKYH